MDEPIIKKETNAWIEVEHFAPSPKAKEPSSFLPMLQGPTTNKFAAIDTRYRDISINGITGEGIIELGSLTVYIAGQNEIIKDIKPSTHKMLDACILLFTQQNSLYADTIQHTIRFSLSSLMKLYGKPDTKPSRDKMRRLAIKELDAIYSISLSNQEQPHKRKGKNQTAIEETGNYAKSRVIAAHRYKDGYFEVDFAPQTAQYLTRRYITHFSTRLFSVDDRNPSTYSLGKKLQLHAGMDNNIKSGTCDIISVKALLGECPAIPKYDEVMTKDRNINKGIVTPFEKALNELADVGFLELWEYCSAKKVPLTEEQLAGKPNKDGSQTKIVDYEVFEKSYIHFKLADAPDQAARIKASENKAKEASKRKERAIQRNIAKSQNKKLVAEIEEIKKKLG